MALRGAAQGGEDRNTNVETPDPSFALAVQAEEFVFVPAPIVRVLSFILDPVVGQFDVEAALRPPFGEVNSPLLAVSKNDGWHG